MTKNWTASDMLGQVQHWPKEVMCREAQGLWMVRQPASTRIPGPHTRRKTHQDEGPSVLEEAKTVFPCLPTCLLNLPCLVLTSFWTHSQPSSFQLPPGSSLLRVAALNSCILFSTSVRPSEISPTRSSPTVLWCRPQIPCLDLSDINHCFAAFVLC